MSNEHKHEIATQTSEDNSAVDINRIRQNIHQARISFVPPPTHTAPPEDFIEALEHENSSFEGANFTIKGPSIEINFLSFERIINDIFRQNSITNIPERSIAQTAEDSEILQLLIESLKSAKIIYETPSELTQNQQQPQESKLITCSLIDYYKKTNIQRNPPTPTQEQEHPVIRAIQNLKEYNTIGQGKQTKIIFSVKQLKDASKALIQAPEYTNINSEGSFAKKTALDPQLKNIAFHYRKKDNKLWLKKTTFDDIRTGKLQQATIDKRKQSNPTPEDNLPPEDQLAIEALTALNKKHKADDISTPPSDNRPQEDAHNCAHIITPANQENITLPKGKNRSIQISLTQLLNNPVINAIATLENCDSQNPKVHLTLEQLRKNNNQLYPACSTYEGFIDKAHKEIGAPLLCRQRLAKETTASGMWIYQNTFYALQLIANEDCQKANPDCYNLISKEDLNKINSLKQARKQNNTEINNPETSPPQGKNVEKITTNEPATGQRHFPAYLSQ